MTACPIFVLSLATEEKRRAPLVQALSALNLEFELVAGIDGRFGLPEIWESHIDRRGARRAFGRDLTDGEFACALSHREIYRAVLARGLPGAIVLEDDAILGAAFKAFVQGALYRQAPMIMLDHSHARVAGAGPEILPGIRMRRLTLPSCRSTGYALSAAAAASLLRAAQPITMPADWPGNVVSLGAAVLVPPLVGHPSATDGSSHLEVERSQIPQQRGRLQRGIGRLISPAFWRRWVTKRRSTRVS